MIHIYGMGGLAETSLADYRRLLDGERLARDRERTASRLLIVIEQLAHEINTPGLELRLQAAQMGRQSKLLIAEEWNHLVKLGSTGNRAG